MSERVTPEEIAEWISSNAAREIIGHITFPEAIKHQLVRHLWRSIPPEQLELEDFVRWQPCRKYLGNVLSSGKACTCANQQTNCYQLYS